MTTVIEWFDPREKLPEEDGDYIVYTGNAVPVTIQIKFANSLSDIDELDFPPRLYSHHAGFYEFDESYYRWYEVPLEKIKYWAKMPEIKEEN